MTKDNGETHSIEIEAEDPDQLDSAIREALEVVDGMREREGPATESDETEADALRGQLAEAQDRLVRTLADFDNFRKRTERQRLEAMRYEGFDLLREFLGIVDNLERALGAEGRADDLKQGVEMILRQMRDLLQRFGVERVAAAGEPFDPRLHDAISRSEDATVAEPTVSEELEAGYSMRGRLLRPARVAVAMPAEPEAAEEGAAAAD